MNHGVEAMHGPTLEHSQAWLATLPGQPSVNVISHTQPAFSLDFFHTKLALPLATLCYSNLCIISLTLIIAVANFLSELIFGDFRVFFLFFLTKESMPR